LRPLTDLSPYMVNLGPAIPGPQWVVDPWQAHFDNARETRAAAGFVPVTWSDIEKAPGVYDTAGLDELVVGAHDDGIDLVMQVQSTGEWTVPTPANILASGGRRENTQHPEPAGVTAAPTDIDAAVPFWQELVRRYHPGGTLAREKGWTDGWGVRAYEVENEPDFSAWPGGSWQSVTKDYALFLSHVWKAVHAIDPKVLVAAPGLSGVDPLPGSGNTSTDWLRTLLSTDRASLEYASDDYRAAVPAGPVIGAAPYIDVYSFHCDFGNGVHGELTQRVREVAKTIAAFTKQAVSPTPTHPRLWCSEGAETAYDASDDTKKYRFAWAQMQLAAELLGAGVERFNFDFGIQGGDTGATWQADPIRPATTAMTTFFPSGHGVVETSADQTRRAKHPVLSYRWRDPGTGLSAHILWAPNADAGSGTTGPEFAVPVPVSTRYAVVIDPRTWTRRTVAAKNGVVMLNLSVGDPSPPWIVAETSAAGLPTPTPVTAATPAGRSLPTTGGRPALAALAVALLAAAGLHRRQIGPGRTRSVR
jgi:hypothetical protein